MVCVIIEATSTALMLNFFYIVALKNPLIFDKVSIGINCMEAQVEFYILHSICFIWLIAYTLSTVLHAFTAR